MERALGGDSPDREKRLRELSLGYSVLPQCQYIVKQKLTKLLPIFCEVPTHEKKLRDAQKLFVTNKPALAILFRAEWAQVHCCYLLLL